QVPYQTNNKEIKVDNLQVINDKLNLTNFINNKNDKIFKTLKSTISKAQKSLPSIVPNTNSVFSKKDFYLQTNPEILIKKNTTKEEYSQNQKLLKDGEILNTLDTSIEQKLKYSHHKLNYSLKKIVGLYFDDAINVLEEDYTKGGIWLKKKLNIYKKENPNLFETNDFKLRIKTATVGCQVGGGRVNYRAKGRVDMIYSKLSSFRIMFEKVKKEELCSELVTGKSPNFLKFLIRKRIYSQNLPLTEIQGLRFLTSSKGGYARKRVIAEMVNRLTFEYYKKTNIKLNKDIVEKKVIKQLTSQMIPIYEKYLSLDISNAVKESEEDIKEKKQKMIESRHELYTKNLSLSTKKKSNTNSTSNKK
ncbi:MAG: uL22 family ribosomal protein, partial [bacterium]